ncbi:MAG: L-aspartate oxidase [Euryarchaeota archaeon]|jgi:L-aspartate oxidase|nr:L-aspartate oxidase [Euryarchaeota archaeon]
MVDVTIVGSGIAGLFVAIRSARAGQTVALVTKQRLSDSSTNFAQGGIAGVLDRNDGDALEAHVKDTLEAGGGIGNEKIIRMVVEEAAVRIQDLIDEGVNFHKNDSGNYDLAMEGGHNERRILHAKDATGAEIERALITACLNEQRVTIYEDCLALDLILDDRTSNDRKVVGLWCLKSDSTVFTLPSRAVVLATGGAGQLWRQTTNPSVATGDGIAMAVRAGAAVRDLEFVQFHPTSYSNGTTKSFLISEAVRGDGAVLMTEEDLTNWRAAKQSDQNANPNDFSFMRHADKRGSLATRDIVARAADAELKRSGRRHVLLVTEHLDAEHLAQRFPTIAQKLTDVRIEIGIDPIPVAPAAHYIVGGLAVNEWGEVKQRDLTIDEQTCTSLSGGMLEGLFAIGETACTGLHGANRLASNSLLEAVVFSHRAGVRLQEWLATQGEEKTGLPDWRADGLDNLQEHAPLVHDRAELRSTMSDDMGLVKSGWRMNRASRRLTLLDDEIDRIWRRCLPTREVVELRNMVQLAQMVTAASLKRKENIGLHYNLDLNKKI